jgi:hypothetical protein
MRALSQKKHIIFKDFKNQKERGKISNYTGMFAIKFQILFISF